MSADDEVGLLLERIEGGDRAALDRLFELLYGELRRLAHFERAARRSGETLSTTALVHEVYLRFLRPQGLSVQSRSHFFAVAARAMRQVLVDGARRWLASKRGRGEVGALDGEPSAATDAAAEEVLSVHEALARLAQIDERLARIVEWRFFGGWSAEEIAETLELSAVTVRRELRKARAYLVRELGAVEA